MISDAENAKNLIEILTVVSLVSLVILFASLALMIIGVGAIVDNRYRSRVVVPETDDEHSFEDISAVVSSTEYRTLLSLDRRRAEDAKIFENTEKL